MIGSAIMDSKLETLAIRRMREEPQMFRKLGNSINNSFAETFLSRTSVPYYRDQSSAYPLVAMADQAVTTKVKDIWVHLRESAGSLNRSVSEDWRFRQYYFSKAVRVELLQLSGLADLPTSAHLLSIVYPQIPFWQRVNPPTHPDLGASLHSLPHPQDKIRIVALACRCTFVAHRSWDCFNNVLISSAWPWLKGYSRAYARMIYTAMLLIFAAFETYTFDDTLEMRERLIALAGKLVGLAPGQLGYRVRSSAYLRGQRAAIPLSIIESPIVRNCS